MAEPKVNHEILKSTSTPGSTAERSDTILEERFGKYRLIRVLGTGASGVVYLADDTLLERRVALKILDDKANARSQNRDRFILEARSAAKLSHPQTVAVHEINEAQGRFYIVMEWVKGGSVQQAIDTRGAIPWREATAWILDACHALTAAHDAGMLHRDIKPGNLLLTEDGRAKLGDFGLVKLVGESSPMLTALGGPLGTPSFMSPEQCQGETLDERSDIYSLGATYYALLVGYPPFQSETSFGVMFAHCSSPVPDPRAIHPEIPEACAEIVRRSMAKVPSERFTSVREFAQSLADLIGAEPPIAPAPPTSVKPSRRRKLRLILAGLGLIAATWAFLRIPLEKSESPPALAAAPSPPATPPAVETKPARVETPPTDPLFSSIVPVGTHRGIVDDIEFDASGKKIIAIGRGGTMAVWNPLQPNRPIRFVDPEPPLNSTLLAFGYFPKKSLVITGGNRHEIVLWDLRQGKVIDRAPQKHGLVRAIDVAPDGRMFATGGDIGWNIWELTDDNKMIDKGPLTEGLAVVESIDFSTAQRLVAAATGNGIIAVYDLAYSVPTNSWRFDTQETSVAFSKTRGEFAAGDRKGEIVIGTSTPRLPSYSFNHKEGGVLALDFAPDRRVLAVGGEGSDAITFYDLENKKNHRFSTGTKRSIHSLCFSADGKYLAIGNARGEILYVGVPVEMFSPPTSPQLLDLDRAANYFPNKRQLENASRTLNSLLGTKGKEPQK